MDSNSLYASALLWVFFFLALYWAFCLFWGIRSARQADTARSFFLADRDLGVWPFVMATTATAFAGWIFIGEPALILRDGLPAGYLSFAAIVIPLAGAFLMKRQWLLGKRYGYVTPGEMFADYFQSDVIRVFTAVVAGLFSIPFLGLLLGSAGQLVSIVTDGALSRDTAMWMLSVVLVIYVTLGGIRAVAQVSTLQTLLIAVGTVILGLAALHLAGGFDTMNRALASLAESPVGQWGTTQGRGGGDFNAWFAVTGVAQWTEGLGRETPVGGPWTALMVLTFLVSFIGIQASPAFSMWAYSSRDPKAFAPQQLWASACAAGLLLFIFVTLQGLGGMLLGANAQVADAGYAIARVLPDLSGEQQGMLSAAFMALIGKSAPWLSGILAVCAVVAITACAGAYMTTAGAVATRDLYKHYFNPLADDQLQKRFSRISILIATVLALLMATFARGGIVSLGSLALSFSVQLLPALLAVMWIPWFTRHGVTAGLLVGAVAVVLTDPLGQLITAGSLPWGYWPWTIHAAVWGLAANLAVCTLGSAVTQNETESARRGTFHAFLRDHAGRSTGRRIVTFAWVLTIGWVFLAIGPGIVLGNYLFGEPGAGFGAWDFLMPSIWAWQLLWWGLGVLLVWLLAYRMELSTQPSRQVVALREDATLGRSRPGRFGGVRGPDFSPRPLTGAEPG